MFHTVLIVFVCLIKSSLGYEVIYAVNAGGHEFIDSNHVRYAADLGDDRVGTISDFGLQLGIRRARGNDAYLYQTERYHTDSFHYDIPVDGDGDYVLVLKFAEVYFNAVDMKVFHVALNRAHRIVNSLDIFRTVGKGVAHDENVYFSISDNVLHIAGATSVIENGQSIRVDFIKAEADNPKINAIVLYKGNVKNVPQLPSLDDTYMGMISPIANNDNYADAQIAPAETQNIPEQKVRFLRTSGPKHPDPYELDYVSAYLPVVLVITFFIPLMYWLCSL